MFKKTLLAVTLAALSTSAMAVDVATNSTAATYGSEALSSGVVANDLSVLELGATQLKLGAEYSVGDTIRILISGGELDADDAFALTDTNTNVGSAGITLGLLSSTKTELLFRVTAIDTTNGVSTDGELLDLELTGALPVPVKVSSSTVGSKVAVTATAATSTGLAIDNVGVLDTFNIGSVIKQHAFTVAPVMSSKVDVAKARKQFEVAANSTFTVNYAQTAPTQAGLAIADTKYTVKGSMTGFEATVAATDNNGTIVGDNLLALTVAADLQSASDAIGGAPSAAEVFLFAIDATVADRSVLNIGSYAVDVELEHAGGKKFTYSDLNAGAFAFNGSSATFSYVPVNFAGAVTSQFEIGNKGVVDGEITIDGFDTAGNDYSAILPFAAEAGKLTKISDADIATAFALTGGTKLKLNFTVNAPNDDITYGAYSNRGTTGRMAIIKE
jgi:hypothetical protein